jgi:hypothetical protein
VPRGLPATFTVDGRFFMGSGDQQEREVRAVRNQALFRAVNEKLQTLNDSFQSIMGTFTIACECADTSCIEMVDIEPDEYSAIRAEPRHFAVLPGHVYPEVERVVRESDGHVVVEKSVTGADVEEILGVTPQPIEKQLMGGGGFS